MTAKEYLTQYDSYKRKYKRCIIECKYEAEVLQEIKKYLNAFPAKNRRELEVKFRKCVVFCNDLKNRAQSYKDGMQEIRDVIESIPGLEGEILKLRYIDGLIWEDVCDKVYYSWNKVLKSHNKALKMTEERLKT